MTDIIGPSSSAPNVVTVRPADGRVFNALDTWFKACSAPGANDGTTISDAFLNGLLGMLRTATRGMGIADATAADNLLRDAIRAAKLRFAVAGGTADALTVAFSPPLLSYSEAAFFVVPASANTGAAMTLAADGMATKAVKYLGANPPAGLFQPGIPQLVMYDGTQFQPIGGTDRVGLPKLTIFTSTQTWTRATGATNAFVLAHGPGAAGGGDPSGTSNRAGSGGGPGGWAASILDISALATATVTISAGGVGVAGDNGGDGTGNTSFGTLVVAGPGEGGRTPGSAYTTRGGASGVGITGMWVGRGSPGAPNFGASPDGAGDGGSGLLGGGGRGGNDNPGSYYTHQAGVWGSGGGGADLTTGTVGMAGANGGNGFVIVLEY
ncbi:hypothetical protein V5F41_12270 [Xanthobacter autotrophicus]|uniref:glycine-rich domain-containing protein n=1 Tax=Xanthobacter autotrophicus TaxID=280 RepID=UPI0037291C9D